MRFKFRFALAESEQTTNMKSETLLLLYRQTTGRGPFFTKYNGKGNIELESLDQLPKKILRATHWTLPLRYVGVLDMVLMAMVQMVPCPWCT